MGLAGPGNALTRVAAGGSEGGGGRCTALLAQIPGKSPAWSYEKQSCWKIENSRDFQMVPEPEPACLAAGDFESVIYSVSTGKWGEF